MLGVVWYLPGSDNADAGKVSRDKAYQVRIQSLGVTGVTCCVSYCTRSSAPIVGGHFINDPSAHGVYWSLLTITDLSKVDKLYFLWRQRFSMS